MQPRGCMSTDRIEKQIVVRAPLNRVWRAISDSTEFGAWFGMKFDEPFAPGKTMKCEIVPTTADPEVARKQERYRGTKFEIVIQDIEPQRLLSFRWHPGALDPSI